ncbi:transmembrane protein 132E-like [Panonychus citri]|uniref:transmembrane protein 132E-like n=1 Tax=Panonychus citri TaxID=50023 RepID=UPI00230769AC|nr:transmembrane protein 132E-like [Panonychus citri]
MRFVILFQFFLACLLIHLIDGNHQGRSSSYPHQDQSLDVDVDGGIESGFFLLPSSIVTSGIGSNLNSDSKNDSISSSTSSQHSLTSYYSSLSPSKPIFVKATFGTITATETVFPYQVTHGSSSATTTTTTTTTTANKYQPLKGKDGHSGGKSSNSNNLNFSSKNILNGVTFREKITDSTLVEIDSAHGKHSIAYLVTPTVSRNSPIVRVLFYTTHPVAHSPSIVTSPSPSDPVESNKINTNGKQNNNKENKNSDPEFYSGERSSKGASSSGSSHEASPCIFVSVSKDNENILGSCTPINNREGACLVEITLPAYWWPPVELDSPKSRKSGSISVDYKTFHTNQCNENGSLSNDNIKRFKSLTDAFTHLGQVTLSPFTGTYEEVTNDDIVRILIPEQSTYPNNKIYIPVCFRYNPNYPMTAFRLRARVKSGLRILGVQPSPISPWKISLEVNSKQTLATVTAQLKDNYMDLEDLQSGDSGIHLSLSQEIYSWLIQVNENVDFSDNGRIVWQLEYVTENGVDSPTIDLSSSSPIKLRKDLSSVTSSYTDRDTSKLSSILDIQKDSIQAVIGITSSLSMINTAILTGKQVAQSLKVFAVSQSGRLGDVTLQASCTSTDESVVKVSPACTSIYLDGSEIRGSSNATIAIKYGTYSGSANFIIWVPKLPLEVRVSDGKLSQIKGWKIPHLKRDGRRSYHHNHHHHHQNSIYGSHDEHKSRRSSSSINDNLDFTSIDSDFRCKLRHQQAYINVYASFFSTDHNSGRESYLLNRKVLVKVTKLVTPFLRVTDNRITLIRSNIIEGLAPGRSEIQIVSPITNQIMGSTEIHVDSEKETITSLEVNLITGLSLTIKPEPSLSNVFKIITNISSRLVNQYQEGLLDIKVHFSDSSVTSLVDITDSDYQLSVNTGDNGALAYTPLIGRPYPRVIAIGQGNNQLTISLEVSDQCQRKRTQPLAVTQINADIDLNLPTGHLQNDADFRKYNGILIHRNQNSFQQSSSPSNRDREDVDANDNDGDDLISSYGVAGQSSNLENHHSNAPSIEARSNRAINPSELTPLEVGMYSLLAVFTLAVSLFIVSCFVFRLKGKQETSDPMVATLPLPLGHHSLAHHHRQSGSSNQKVVANANDWIWLGKATLQRNSPPSSGVKAKLNNSSELTQGLISLNAIKNRDESNHHHLDVISGEDEGSNRMSTVSYPGSEISIRITTNPVEESCLDHQDVTPNPSTPFGINKEIEKFYRSVSPAVPAKVNASTSSSSSIPPPIPARRTKGYSSATHSSHLVPPIPPPIPLHQHSQREHFPLKNDPIIIPNHKPPHIPPRLSRSIRCDQVADSSSSSSLSSSYTSPRPPPIPPHSVTTRTTKKPPLPPHRTVSTKFKRPSITSKTLSNNIKMNGQLESLLSSSSSSSSSTAASTNYLNKNNTKDHSNINNRLISKTTNQELINHSSIIVNPSSTLTQLTQENSNRVTKEMNYNQLMEYFQNLKESSA